VLIAVISVPVRSASWAASTISGVSWSRLLMSRPALFSLSPRRFYVRQVVGNGCRRDSSDRQASLLPVVLAAGEACGAVADGGLSTRRARGGKFPEEISDERAPQGHFLNRRPDEGGARRAGADSYNPSGQQPKQKKRFYSPSEARPVSALNGLRPARRAGLSFPSTKGNLAAASSLPKLTGRAGISPKSYETILRCRPRDPAGLLHPPNCDSEHPRVPLKGAGPTCHPVSLSRRYRQSLHPQRLVT
jgi:hypothetical protein